ncbi:hypothetical protein [Streptomyces sp. NPDC088115]|uniref:hypothetical protein n=1 Tax=Streptomyces sp. NPDC088115 TaxID=3365824 RepID=UPI0038114CBE
MSFFKGAFSGQSNSEVLQEQMDAGVKAINAHKSGRRDRAAEQREANASAEMRSRYAEESRNVEASNLISRWGRGR